MKAHHLFESRQGSLWRVLALACAASSVQAQQAPSYGYSQPPPGYSQQYQAQQPPAYQQPQAYPQQRYPQQSYPQQSYPPQGYSQPRTQYVSPMEFLPTFGRKFGDMFRRVFYGDAQPARGYQAPQGYSQQGRSLDTAPPSYQSQYGYGQPAYPSQPNYQQPSVQGQAPQYQPPPPPQSQTVPSPAMPQGNRMSSPAAPRMSLKSPQTPKTPAKAPPKNYTPPTITKKSTPKLEEMPPPVSDKSDKTTSTTTEYYPLPGAQPKTEPSKPSASSKTEKSVGNNGAFLKGKRASKEGRVISPYPPYQELDVTGLSSGSLALDPTTQKVFEVP